MIACKMYILFLILTTLLITGTLAPLSRYEKWWIRGWDFPRLQLFIAFAALIIAEFMVLDMAAGKNLILMGAGALCFMYLGWWIVPYTRLYKKEVGQAANYDPQNNFRIMVANIRMTNKNVKGLLRMVKEHQPDILVILESNTWWQEKLEPLENEYPFTIKCPLENMYGMHVYSRLRLIDPEIRFLIQDDIPSMRAVAVLPGGKRVKIHFLHPTPPWPDENESSEERDAELLTIAREVSENDEPVVVTGDLNDVAWSYTTRLFRKISGLSDPRVGRGMFNTFHAEYFFMRWPLDHLFHSYHFHVVQIRRLQAFGSDHFPILVELAYTDEIPAEPLGLEPTPEDEKAADDIIAKL